MLQSDQVKSCDPRNSLLFNKKWSSHEKKKQTGFQGVKKSKPFFKVQVYNDGCVPFRLQCSKIDHGVDFTKPLLQRANVL